MKVKDFKDRLAGKVYSIEIVDDTRTSEYGDFDPDDTFSRPNTSTEHNIRGFSVGGESQYYDEVVLYEPEKGTTYYVLYAIYSTGDSFGHDEAGGIEYYGFYREDQLDVAKENKRRLNAAQEGAEAKIIMPDGSKEHNVYVPWLGYFESLDDLDIAPVERLN